jgi:RNA polymerase sigma-70 factor (ECF subfamily)
MTSLPLSDAELLARVPEPDAVEAFYRGHVDAVFRFVARRSARSHDVADVVSATFVEVIRSARRFDERRGTSRSWVLGIARNCLNDDLRARGRREELIDMLGTAPQLTDDESEAVDRMIDAASAAAPLIAAMRTLTPTERGVLELVAYDGLRVSEAADVATTQRHQGAQELWIDARGRGKRVVRGGGSPPSSHRLRGGVTVGDGQISFAALSRIAADPAHLERLISAQARSVIGLPDRQARAFVTYRLLEESLLAAAPAPVRAALLRQLATAPGLRRAGSAVMLTIGDIRFTLLLRGTTIVGTERRLLRRSAQAPGTPRVLDAWRLVAAGTVTRLGDQP